MKKIVVLGAGLSSSSLIKYLLSHAEEYLWEVHIIDRNLELMQSKIGNSTYGFAHCIDALDPLVRKPIIEQATVVISMLPARFHPEIAKDCLTYEKHLITPSYVSKELKAMHYEAKVKDLVFMNEIGVDPGIDHMSAMKIIDELEHQGAKIVSFKSFCGGLIAPESDNNPWNYKFTWNPRNVVLAGSGGNAQFIDHDQYKFIPYHRLFTRLDQISVPGFGEFDGYANRDSLSYRATYGLEGIPTMYRGTLRKRGFCENWNVFIQLGMTDDSYSLENSEGMSYREFLNAFLPYKDQISIEHKFQRFIESLGLSDATRFEYLNLFSKDHKLEKVKGSPAQCLEEILVKKLSLNPNEKDMVIMVHQFEAEKENQLISIDAWMVDIGHDQVFTSMSNTVGLPIAIFTKLLLLGKINQRGVLVPTDKEVYIPILRELEEDFGIHFIEKKSLSKNL